MDLLLNFFDDAGVIALNDHLFSMLDGLARDADGDVDLDVGDAVAALRFFVQLMELGIGDAVVTGASVMELVQTNFPALHAYLTHPEDGVDPPIDSRFDYRRFCSNFRQVIVSLVISYRLETQSVIFRFIFVKVY